MRSIMWDQLQYDIAARGEQARQRRLEMYFSEGAGGGWEGKRREISRSRSSADAEVYARSHGLTRAQYMYLLDAG